MFIDEGEEESDDIFEGLRINQLNAHCHRRGLSRTGRKSVLLNRLREYEQRLIEEDDTILLVQ